jgi:hypothetical protein
VGPARARGGWAREANTGGEGPNEGGTSEEGPDEVGGTGVRKLDGCIMHQVHTSKLNYNTTQHKPLWRGNT